MLTVRQCMIGETAWFRKLEGEYHYMGESHGAGDVVRLVFEEDGAPVALMTWAAACYCLKARDGRIGWNPAMRARRLKLVANNRRYTALVAKPTKETAWHVSSLDPDSRGAEEFAGIVRTHWCVEAYHGRRDNGYHEDAFTRRCDLNVMAAMMVARSLGLWICARHPDRTVSEVRRDLFLHPPKLFRVMTKGGLL